METVMQQGFVLDNEMVYPVNYNSSYYACMKNEIIEGRQVLSMREFRLIRLLITQIVKNSTDFKTYVVRIEELADFLDIDSSNMYRDMSDICRSLQQRIISIKTNNPKQPWKNFNWLEKSEYDGKGNVILMLSNQLKPYLIELNDFFTQYQFKEISGFSSFYAARIYEILLSKIGQKYGSFQSVNGSVEITLTFNELRTMLGCENKIAENANFKKRVIDFAVSQINDSENTRFKIRTEYKKMGRSFNSVIFHILSPAEFALISAE